MQINLETDERTGKLRGTDGQEGHNIHTLTGKYEITEAELEDAISTFSGSQVTFNFNDEKTKGKP